MKSYLKVALLLCAISISASENNSKNNDLLPKTLPYAIVLSTLPAATKILVGTATLFNPLSVLPGIGGVMLYSYYKSSQSPKK